MKQKSKESIQEVITMKQMLKVTKLDSHGTGYTVEVIEF